MYKPPITIYQALRDSLNIQLENNVCKAVASYGINVDKDELIKALKYDREQYEKGYEDGKAEIQWIPCSERLPEENGEYLCQRHSFYGDMMEVCRFSNNLFKVDKYDFHEHRGRKKKKGFYGYDSEWGYYEIDDVIAWMPLPEPYKEEEKE